MTPDDIAKIATILSAGPVAIAAIVFLCKTLPAYFIRPEGLHIEVGPAVGDPGYFVHIANYGPLDHHVEYVGVMPADFRPIWPLWVRATRRIAAKRNSVKSLSESTMMAAINCTISSGKSYKFLVPQAFDENALDDQQRIQQYDALIRRYRAWQRAPGGPSALVPYVRLSTGNIVLGRKLSPGKEVQCLANMSCKCGHAITQHQLRRHKRLTVEPSFYAYCDTCRCRQYKEVGESIH